MSVSNQNISHIFGTKQRKNISHNIPYYFLYEQTGILSLYSFMKYQATFSLSYFFCCGNLSLLYRLLYMLKELTISNSKHWNKKSKWKIFMKGICQPLYSSFIPMSFFSSSYYKLSTIKTIFCLILIPNVETFFFWNRWVHEVVLFKKDAC